MSEETLGAGIYLDRDLDFEIDQTGDLRSESGSAELQKDLAFQLQIILSEYIGLPMRPGTVSDIKSDTIRTLISDDRVDSVDRSSFVLEQVGDRSLFVQVVVFAGGEQQELVFNVG
jgi:hypothetical protein